MTDLLEALKIVGDYAQARGATAAGVESWCRNEHDSLARERRADRHIGGQLAAKLGVSSIPGDRAAELGAYARRLCSTTQEPDPTPDSPAAVDLAPEKTGSEQIRSRNVRGEQ